MDKKCISCGGAFRERGVMFNVRKANVQHVKDGKKYWKLECKVEMYFCGTDADLNFVHIDCAEDIVKKIS